MTYPEIIFLNTILQRMKASINNGCVLLEEKTNTQAGQLQKVTIDGLSNDYICLKPDDAKIKLFIKGYGNKQCDYIILNENNGQKIALFIELKSKDINDVDVQNQSPKKKSDGEYSDYVLQLRSSSCLLDYLDSVLSAFCQCNNIRQDYKRYFTVLHNKVIPPIQSSVQPMRPVPNTSPEKALIKKVENDKHIQFHTFLIEEGSNNSGLNQAAAPSQQP